MSSEDEEDFLDDGLEVEVNVAVMVRHIISLFKHG